MRLLLLLLFLPIFGRTQTTISAGSVSGLWTLSGSPYIISGDITVPNGNQLTIEAGVEVLFAGYFGLIAEGVVHADGNPSDSIYFDIQDTTGYSSNLQAGSWKGIALNGTGTENSLFDHCVFQHTFTEDEAYFVGPTPSNNFIHFGTLCLFSSDSTQIENCRFAKHKGIEPYDEDALTGVLFISHSDVEAKKNLIEDCRHKVGILANRCTPFISENEIRYMSNGSGIDVSTLYQAGCRIYNNYVHHNSSFRGGGIRISTTPADIRFNRIEYNEAVILGAGVSFSFAHNSEFISNIVANNRVTQSTPSCNFYGGAGINIMGCKNMLLQNNTIVNNTASDAPGGGVLFWGNTARFYNNLVANNDATFGGGIYHRSADSSRIVNSIIWNNASVVSTYSEQISYYSNIIAPFDFKYINCSVENQSFIDLGQTTPASLDTSAIFSIDPEIMTSSAGIGYLFDATQMNWDLSSSTPMIDLGINDTTGYNFFPFDVYGDSRILGSACDIGPQERGESSSLIELADEQVHFTIYPNPTIGFITIESRKKKGTTYLTITDIYGREVKRSSFDSSIRSEDIPSANGVYFISLSDGEKLVYNLKVIKK